MVRIVEFVEKNACLWDTRLAQNKKAKEKSRVWMSIGADYAECKKEWNQLRGQYVRERNKERVSRSSGKGLACTGPTAALNDTVRRLIPD